MSCLFVLDKERVPCQVRTRGKQSEDLSVCSLAVRRCGPAYGPMQLESGGKRRRRKRTQNIEYMVVTLEVSKLSG